MLYLNLDYVILLSFRRVHMRMAYNYFTVSKWSSEWP